MRSRGGALPSKPDHKMGRWSNPKTWFVDGRDKPRLKRMLKQSTTRKRRQRDRRVGGDS